MESRKMVWGQRNELTIAVLNDTVHKWKSDLQFYKEDLLFIQHIMDHNLAAILLHENLDEIRESTMRLEDLKYRCAGLLRSITSFSIKVGNSIQGVAGTAVGTGYTKLKGRIQGFRSDFKALKVEIFSIANNVMELEKRDKQDFQTDQFGSALTY